MQAVCKANSISDLYLYNEQIYLKPENLLGRLVVDVWERCAMFCGHMDKKKLILKVIEILEEDKSLEKYRKAQSLGIGRLVTLNTELKGTNDEQKRKRIKGEMGWLLGLKKVAGGSTESAYFVFDPFEEDVVVGVFKTEQMRSLITKCMLFVKSFFGQKRLLDQRPCAEAISEIAAHSLYHSIGVDATPPIEGVRFGGIEGTFQEYIKKGAGDLAKDHWFAKGKYTLKELEIFQKYVLGSFLSGDLDANRENTLLELDLSGELLHIWSIDNANAFPEKMASKWSLIPAPCHQYGWAKEEIAKKHFTPGMIEWVKSIIERKDEIMKDLEGLLQDSRSLLSIRFEVLEKKYKEGKFSPSDLRQYIYKENVEEFLYKR